MTFTVASSLVKDIGLEVAEGFRRLRLSGFLENQHMNLVRFSALPTDFLFFRN
jgi:hypothetical protein